MTFVGHGIGGAALHGLVMKLAIVALSPLLDVSPAVSAYLVGAAAGMGIVWGMAPDVLDWIVALDPALLPRWRVYGSAHHGALYEKFGQWVPAWRFHVFVDRFFHANGLPEGMQDAWRSRLLTPWPISVTLYDLIYVAREACGWATSVSIIVITIIK